ncbi:MAG: hypothetical protein AAFQ82_12885, partial [Myxococcota bacterium]
MRRLGLCMALAGTLACGKAETPAVDAFTPSTNPLLDNGRPADAVIGQMSFQGEDAGTTTAAGVNGPSGVAAGARTTGEVEIWVADQLNNRVLGWQTSGSFDIPDGAPADLIIGQDDAFTTNARFIPTDERITPTSVAVDQGVGLNGGRRLYVSTNTGQVLVYEDPFATDTRPDYELLGLPGGAVKVESFGEDLLAVHNTVSVFFYREGSPDRLTFQTSGSGVSTLSSPCTAGSISAIAGGASNLFLACSASAGTCPGGVASPPADCSNGSTAAA